MTYNALEEVFKRWLLMPDTSLLRVVLASWVANRLEGVPVWLMVVGPPSSGKTEILQALAPLPQTFMVGSLSGEAALLSATPRQTRASDATGGLLRQIGQRGTLILKDFTSILEMHREKRAEVFKSLREIYDGHWNRPVGSEGGRTIGWEGHCGLLAGVTPAIEHYHSISSSMGERWMYYRLIPPPRGLQARLILAQRGKKKIMQAELREAVTEYVGKLDLSCPVDVTQAVGEYITRLGDWVTNTRSSVHRNARGELDSITQPEAPARLTLLLLQVYHSLVLMGTNKPHLTVRRLALDCIPEIRMEALLGISRTPQNTADLVRSTRLPSRSTAVRALEDLSELGTVTRTADGVWKLSGDTEAKVKLTPSDEVGYAGSGGKGDS